MATDGCSAQQNPEPAQFYLDEKWKLSKKESSSRSCRSSASFLKNPTHKRCAFTRKCARLVKEQRARFYIMRRCVTMLICWRDYSDSWTQQREEEVFEKEYIYLYISYASQQQQQQQLFFSPFFLFLLRDCFSVLLKIFQASEEEQKEEDFTP